MPRHRRRSRSSVPGTPCGGPPDALRGLSVDARLGKILEPANVEHCRVPHVLKRFPGQRRPTTRAAVQEDRLVFLESGVVKLALGVSPELQHAPRDVHCTFDLSALRTSCRSRTSTTITSPDRIFSA